MPFVHVLRYLNKTCQVHALLFYAKIKDLSWFELVISYVGPPCLLVYLAGGLGR